MKLCTSKLSSDLSVIILSLWSCSVTATGMVKCLFLTMVQIQFESSLCRTFDGESIIVGLGYSSHAGHHAPFPAITVQGVTAVIVWQIWMSQTYLQPNTWLAAMNFSYVVLVNTSWQRIKVEISQIQVSYILVFFLIWRREMISFLTMMFEIFMVVTT
jgi:hypothetical protein